jgi:uncharacterized protein (UPF0335 family)
MATPTLEELAKRMDALEKENANLKARVESMYTELTGTGTTPSMMAVRSLPLASAADSSALMEKDTTIAKLQTELRTVKSKVNNRYSSDDVSEYIGDMIDNFNSKATVRDSPVGYMVSNVDLELKAQVVKEGEDFMFMSADPESKSADSMSTIKISVRAVPK